MRRSIFYGGLLSLLICLPWPASASWTSPWHDTANTSAIIAQPESNFIQHLQLTNQYISPIIEQNLLITAINTGNTRFIIATNLKSKQEAWRYSLGSSYPRGVSIANQTLYISLSTKATLIAVNLSTGHELWQHNFNNERNIRYAPVAYQQELYVVSSQLYKLDQFGNEQWAKNFDISALPAVDDTGIYFRAHNLSLFKLDRSNGSTIWQENIDTTEGTQVVLGGELAFSGTNQAIVALNKQTGQRAWTHLTGDNRKTTGDISYAHDLLIFSSSYGDITALSAEGQVAWSQRLNTSNIGGNGWFNEFIIGGRIIITRSASNQTTYLDLTSGKLLNELTSPLGIDNPVAIDPPYLISVKDTTLTVFTATDWLESEQSTKPSEKIPLLIIPGLLESWPINRVWQLDPFIGIYTTLFKTLHSIGYQDNIDLFTFPYDWHESNTVTAELLARKIASIKEIAHADKIDIITHSMGGLVAAAYVESSYYLNDVNNLLTIATPYNGAVKAYLTWEAGFVGNGSIDGLKELFIKYEAVKHGYPFNVVGYIQRYFPATRDLLPKFDYLVKDRLIPYDPCDERDQPCNPFLETLLANRNQLTSRVKLFNIIGNNGGNSTLSHLIVSQSASTEFWRHGMPLDYPKTTGLGFDQGDGTVLTSSAHLEGVAEATVEADHTAIVAQAAKTIAKYLANQEPNIPIEAPASRFLFIKAFSPIDLSVSDGQNQTGYDSIHKVIDTEIPQSFYSGNFDDQEYIIIANPREDNTYHLTLTGTGTGGYTVEISYIDEDSALTTQVADTIKEGKVHPYTFNFTNEQITVIDLDPTPPLSSSPRTPSPSAKTSLTNKTPGPTFIPLPKSTRYPVAQMASPALSTPEVIKSSHLINNSKDKTEVNAQATSQIFSAPIASPSAFTAPSNKLALQPTVKGVTRALPKSTVILVGLFAITCISGIAIILTSYYEHRRTSSS